MPSNMYQYQSSTTTTTTTTMLQSKPTFSLSRSFSPVNVGHLRFIIMDCPTPETLPNFIMELKARGVTHVIRLCEPSYDSSLLLQHEISLVDLPYPDGSVPPPHVLSTFLTLAEGVFGSLPNSLSKDIVASKKVTILDHSPVIAVHCVAGLGRAPVLVAVALVEAGFAPIEAIDFVRSCRRGAFNALQLRYLMDSYKKRPSKSALVSGFGAFLKRTPSPPTTTLAPPSHASPQSSLASSSSVTVAADASGAASCIASNGTGTGTDGFFKKMFSRFKNKDGVDVSF